MLTGESSVDAGALEELVENLLVSSIVDCLVAFGALQVPCSLLIDMGIRRGGCVFRMVAMRLALVVFLPTALPGCRSGSGAGVFNCPQSSSSRVSMVAAVRPWCTLVWHVWHWYPLLWGFHWLLPDCHGCLHWSMRFFLRCLVL